MLSERGTMSREVLTALQTETQEFEARAGEKIISTPPLLAFVESALWDKSPAEIQAIVAQSHRFDHQYSTWETVRKAGVPQVGAFKTGFEGYLVGRANSSDEALHMLLSFGNEIWDGLRARYRHSYSHRRMLEKVVLGESQDPAGITEWNTLFGASIAKRRAEISQNTAAQLFRDTVKTQASALPQVRYVVQPNGAVTQEYYVARKPATPQVPSSFRNDAEQLSLLTMANIGRFGHPLFRAAIKYA